MRQSNEFHSQSRQFVASMPIEAGLASSGSTFDASCVTRPRLGPREIEILITWIHADSKAATARRLDIATTTVKTALQRIRAKYKAVGRPAPTKAALVARAIQDGLINIEDL
jgi:DNA-binding CsgD family transcriptional regulator